MAFPLWSIWNLTDWVCNIAPEIWFQWRFRWSIWNRILGNNPQYVVSMAFPLWSIWNLSPRSLLATCTVSMAFPLWSIWNFCWQWVSCHKFQWRFRFGLSGIHLYPCDKLIGMFQWRFRFGLSGIGKLAEKVLTNVSMAFPLWSIWNLIRHLFWRIGVVSMAFPLWSIWNLYNPISYPIGKVSMAFPLWSIWNDKTAPTVVVNGGFNGVSALVYLECC